MKIALVHDWLTGMRGGERCLEAFLEMYPQAEVHTLVHVPGATSELIDAHVVGVSGLQRVPKIEKRYRQLLPLYPLAIRTLDLRGYDVVISLSHAAAKNVIVAPQQLHICYCFTPMRYIWDQARTYFGYLTPALWPILAQLQRWDRVGAKSVTHFVAISRLVAARIRCFYGRSSSVVYPPVNDFWFQGRLPCRRGEALLYAGALVPYKRVDLIVKACTDLAVPLWVVGSGPMEAQLKALAGRNVQFFGAVDDHELREIYANSKGLLFTAKEDFGIIPLESQAVGRPVVGIYQGGVRETVAGVKLWTAQDASSGYSSSGYPLQGCSGVFVEPRTNEKESVQVLKTAVEYFLDRQDAFSPRVCREQARSFSVAAFRESWSSFLRKHSLSELVPKEEYAQGKTAAL